MISNIIPLVKEEQVLDVYTGIMEAVENLRYEVEYCGLSQREFHVCKCEIITLYESMETLWGYVHDEDPELHEFRDWIMDDVFKYIGWLQ